MNKSIEDYMKKDFVGRKSNFECMRILAMLMIVGFHMALNGVLHFWGEEACQTWSMGTVMNRMFTCLFFPGGQIGVALFFMITGYFQIDRNKMDLTKIILESLFYGSILSVIGIGLIFIGDFGVSGLSVKSVILFGIRSVFNPATGENWWFVTVYFLLMLISPLLNYFLRLLTQKGTVIFLIVFWVLWYSVPRLTSNNYTDISRGVFFYMVGAFYRRFGKPYRKDFKKCGLFLSVIASWLAGSACGYILSYIKVSCDTYIVWSIIADVLGQALFSVVTPFCAWGIFVWFVSWNIGSIKWINRIAGTTFGVYLIHDSYITRTLIWHTILRVDTVQYASPLFPVYAILSIGGVFCGCSLIDLCRQKWAEPWMTERFRSLMKRAKHLLCSKTLSN